MGPLKKWHVRPCENPVYIIFVGRLKSLALPPATVRGIGGSKRSLGDGGLRRSE